MSWEKVELLNASGKPIEKKVRNEILTLVEKTLANPDVDPDVLINIATKISGQIQNIQNLLAYTHRAMFRASKKASLQEKKRLGKLEQLTPQEADRLCSSEERVEPVEKQILIRELLESLDGIEREIYLRRIQGYTFEEIDKILNLKPRTSEYRFGEAQARLQALSKKHRR